MAWNLAVPVLCSNPNKMAPLLSKYSSLLDIPSADIDGNPVDLKEYCKDAKVILVVNVASY
jgi:hypothetical protein